MDVAQTRFETDKKIVTLLDAPGHKDFIPNMITGKHLSSTHIAGHTDFGPQSRFPDFMWWCTDFGRC